MTRVAFVQAHHTDIQKSDRTCVPVLRDSGIFDHVVIAGADVAENQELVEFAEAQGVESVLGATSDVVDRMRKVAKEYNASTLARVLLYWFYVDVDLIRRQMDFMEVGDLDYVYLPYDFDIRFGADVLSNRAIETLSDLLTDNSPFKADVKFRPWHFLESNIDGLWQSQVFEDVPAYDNEMFYRLRDDIRDSCSVAWSQGPGFHHHEYAEAMRYIGKADLVLDVGCGFGEGTRMLADHCRLVKGTDISHSYIEEAISRHRHPKLEFKVENAEDLHAPDHSYDVVVCVHAMEHFGNDDQFVKEASRVLKLIGRFVGEVPLRMRRPFIHNDEPFGFDHEREYDVDGLQVLLSEHFSIEKLFGVNRGVYTDVSQARNAIGFVCRKPRDY